MPSYLEVAFASSTGACCRAERVVLMAPLRVRRSMWRSLHRRSKSHHPNGSSLSPRPREARWSKTATSTFWWSRTRAQAMRGTPVSPSWLRRSGVLDSLSRTPVVFQANRHDPCCYIDMRCAKGGFSTT